MQDEIDLFDWMDEVENDGDEVINVRADDDRDELSDGDSIAVEFTHAFERTTNTLIGEVTDVTNDVVDGHVVTFEADGVTYVVRGQRVEKYGESGSYRLKGFYSARESDDETLVADGGRNGPHPTTVPANADERTDETSDTLADRVPDNVREMQTTAMRDADPEGYWATDAPVCLNCRTVNVTAYGGGKRMMKVDGKTYVAEECHDCEQPTIQYLQG